MNNDPDDEILLETMRIGNAVEVRAISSLDGLEVSFQAPVSATEGDIQRLARAKLSFVRKRHDTAPPEDEGGSDGRGGILA
jgi:hypothetical protein